MSDPTGPAPLDVRPAKESWLSRVSIVWLVPLFALLVSLGVAWQSYANRGVLIEIEFENASGIAADETTIKYRDVDVGRVEKVSFSSDLEVVVVAARIDRNVAPFLDDDAQFWVVTPDVSVRGISGLETVLSGVFIEGTWDTEADVAQTNFVGLEKPPLTTASQRGTAIVLRARDGSALADGAPILHKGIEVGYLEEPTLSPNGQSVTVNAFVEAPYDRILTTNTRFWDTSGFSISLGAGGVSLDVDSIASLIEGGIAFDTVVSGGQPIRNGQIFNLFESAELARESLFDDGPAGELLNVSVLFDGSVNGLTVGSDVRFQGITVGEVLDLAAVVSEDSTDTRIQLRAVLGIDPTRLGMQDDATPDFALNFLSEYVEQGLRARLATGNILSGALVVQLTEVENVEPAVFDLSAEPYPVLPSAPSAITDVADTADDVLQRINDLPIEDLMNSAISLMNSLEDFANDDQVREAPESLVALLNDTRSLITSTDVQALAPDARQLLSDADTLLASFVQADLAARISTFADQADLLAASLVESSKDWPSITTQTQALLETANSLQLETTISEANLALEQVNQLLSTEELAALPASLQQSVLEAQAAITDIRALVAQEDLQAIPADVRAGLTRLTNMLATAEDNDLIGTVNSAAQSAAAAASALEEGSARLPNIMEQAEAFVAQANELELQALINSASSTLQSVETLLNDAGTQDLPRSVSDAANELQTLLSEIREGGAIESLNAALSSANSAAQAIEDAAESLPALSARATALARQADAVLQNYDERSRFSTETLSTLRDIQDAADAVSSLARTIQRNPNSLLTGR